MAFPPQAPFTTPYRSIRSTPFPYPTFPVPTYRAYESPGVPPRPSPYLAVAPPFPYILPVPSEPEVLPNLAHRIGLLQGRRQGYATALRDVDEVERLKATWYDLREESGQRSGRETTGSRGSEREYEKGSVKSTGKLKIECTGDRSGRATDAKSSISRKSQAGESSTFKKSKNSWTSSQATKSFNRSDGSTTTLRPRDSVSAVSTCISPAFSDLPRNRVSTRSTVTEAGSKNPPNVKSSTSASLRKRSLSALARSTRVYETAKSSSSPHSRDGAPKSCSTRSSSAVRCSRTMSSDVTARTRSSRSELQLFPKDRALAREVEEVLRRNARE